MAQSSILIKNISAIVSCDQDDRVYRDVDLYIEGNQIKRIAQGIQAPDARKIDGRHKFVYPGLVNTHHHFFQTFVRNLIKVDYVNISVMDWLDIIYRIFPCVNDEVIYYSSLTAMADLIKRGCTTAFDHQYCNPKPGTEFIDRQMDAAALLGIRFHAGRGANTISKKHGSPIPDAMVETVDEFLGDCRRLIGKYHDPNTFSMRQIVVAPCQPVNMYQEDYIESIRFARDHGVRLHTHLGEGETGIMLARYGRRTLDWCEHIGFLGKDVWFAHGWELVPEEYSVMAQAGSGLAHCPGPAVLGGYPILDIAGMQKAGMTVGLGCDGSATNDSSSMLDTLRMGYLMQTYFAKTRGGCVTPYQMLKCATVEGAKILGRDDIGSLSEGKAADLFMIDMDALELCGTGHDPMNLLARVGVVNNVWLTIINGKIVWENNQFPGIDEQELTRKGEEVHKRILRDQFEGLYSL